MVWEKNEKFLKDAKPIVLILVCVEDGVGAFGRGEQRWSSSSLNPCLRGRWCGSEVAPRNFNSFISVLILVCVEDGVGALRSVHHIWYNSLVLILVCVEDGVGEGFRLGSKHRQEAS